MDGTKKDLAPLYRRLPHGPHGMNREEVARHQRARLYGGMIESISERGYSSTTVAHVIGLAGVSRRAFYEQFSNKQECFLATYDIVVARSRKQVLEAWDSERGWANRLHASYKTFLDDIVADPKGAHLVLVDSLGIGLKARERLHLAGSAYERLVAAAFRASPDTTPLPPIASHAIVGGVRHVVFNRLREGRVSELRHLADELLDWVEAYRSPSTTRLNGFARQGPPFIPLAAAAFLASEDRRARVLSSVVHLTLDEGYSELTDPQIAQFAGLSTEAFHKYFASKEACFLAVIDALSQEALAVVKENIRRACTWTEAVPIAVAAFIEYLVAHPALLRMGFVELFEVGPGMISRLTKAIDCFTGLLAEGAPEPCRAPEIACEAVTGAVWHIISAYAASDRVGYLPCLADRIAFVVLAPYTGPKAAVDAIEQAHRRPRLVLSMPRPALGPEPVLGGNSASGSKSASRSKAASGRLKSVPDLKPAPGSKPASGKPKRTLGKPKSISPKPKLVSSELKPASGKPKRASGKLRPVSDPQPASDGPKPVSDSKPPASGKPGRAGRGSSSTASRSRRQPPK